MFQGIKLSIRRFLNKRGYEVVKIKDIAASFEVGEWLDRLQIETILDIGANEGQFARSIGKKLPGKKIYSFEPIKGCYDKLVANTKHLDITTFHCGLSDHSGESEINVSENLVSSSILPMADIHKELYPDSHYTQKENISLKRLDDVMADVKLKENVLVKIDVQGYEGPVIKGGGNTLKQAAAIITEYSYQPMYEGQWLFDDTHSYFTEMGFKFTGVADQVNSKKTGIPIYGDAIFIRNDLLKKVYE